ncbi:hypothetical protein IU459_19280 [Nocardia amamiensis]|uniref:Uncharacterized protein n=1 Tax=Nocardia amamiensis TaxID=404578 RepID=A0ABS0CSU3_9NOCA|nr:hypothetical protein [Nocardia amamiensis]MBF6299664.1 hypothetical protein [Nocardia amamiensis]
MTRITRLTIGALLTVAVLSPAATAQAEIPQPTPSASLVDAGDSGSASGTTGLVCTIIKLVLMNQGPEFCR